MAKEKLENLKELRELQERQELADLMYEHIPDDEAYSIVHRHVHGIAHTLPMKEVRKKLKHHREIAEAEE